jgi:hypothetical protein
MDKAEIFNFWKYGFYSISYSLKIAEGHGERFHEPRD